MIDPELQAAFRELLKSCDESHLKYEEEHGDAGDAYTHCVTEDVDRAKEALVEYILVNFPDWTPDEVQSVVDEFDEWSFDMEPGHTFSHWKIGGGDWLRGDKDTDKKGCCVWGAAIEEVENQYEVARIAASLDCSIAEVRELVLHEKDFSHSDFCIGTIYRPESFDTFETYQCTDACWFAVVPHTWFTDKIEEVRERQAV